MKSARLRVSIAAAASRCKCCSARFNLPRLLHSPGGPGLFEESQRRGCAALESAGELQRGRALPRPGRTPARGLCASANSPANRVAGRRCARLWAAAQCVYFGASMRAPGPHRPGLLLLLRHCGRRPARPSRGIDTAPARAVTAAWRLDSDSGGSGGVAADCGGRQFCSAPAVQARRPDFCAGPGRASITSGARRPISRACMARRPDFCASIAAASRCKCCSGRFNLSRLWDFPRRPRPFRGIAAARMC